MTEKNRIGIMKLGIGWLLIVLLMGMAWSQQQPERPRSAPPVNQSDDPMLKNFRWRSIGPASMSGRIDDIDVVESNPFVIYLGFATAGVWKTVNNGTTWQPIFDTYPTSSIGDIAIFQADPNIIWVGTGEPNNRQSSSFGDGIYKSTDGGKTFTNMGLKETQTISRVVVDPKDPNVVYVSAPGRLFAPNKERGIYKTTDGGKTWSNVKFIDEDTGFTDLVMDRSDPKVLYASSYQRRRTPWGFNGGGPGSGIWKTIDAGKTWTRLTGNGLPAKEMGRIGLDVCRSNPNVIYAQIELAALAPAGGAPGMAGAPPQAPGQPQQPPQPPNPERSGVWRSDDSGKTWRIVSNNNNRPMYYSKIRVDPSNPEIVYTGGAPFFKSTDGGKTFQQVPGLAHSDHHGIWINPKNGNHILVGSDGGLSVTYDQCATWEHVNNMAVGQFYAVAVDMRKPYYVYGGLQDNGSWGGPSAAWGAPGITNADWYRIGGGDGFYVRVDPTDHNTIYVESQNGAVSRLDLRTGTRTSIRPRAPAPPRQQQATADRPAEPSPDMAAMAQAMGFGAASNVVPAPPAGEQYRFNWNMPIHLSPHNPRIVYVGANKLFKSLDRGDTWTASPDLTKQIDRNTLAIMGVPGDKPMLSKHDGTSNYGNITTLAESPAMPGILWVGTDDGSVQVSRDGGATWTNVADNIPGVPKTHQVSRVEPSHFDAGTCYVSIDGHRSDDHKPYVFVTADYGQTWKSLVANLPMGNVNVIKEDPKNGSLLYLGTEYALYVSLNGGAEWKRFMTGLPTVRIDDILVHPRDNDLLVATHGRSIYVIDDIAPLQQLSDKVMESETHLFDVRPGTHWIQNVTLSRFTEASKHFIGENPAPGTAISYYLKSAAEEDVKIAIVDFEGKVVRDLTGSKEAGLQRVQWDLRGNPPQRPQGGGRGAQAAPAAAAAAAQQAPPAGMGALRGGPPVPPGTYRVRLTVGGKEYFTKVQVEADTNK